ncbi:MAG: hypothetical protein AAF629_01645 [Chloroflexota bacterium]
MSSKKDRVKKKRVNKGPAPRQPAPPQSRFTARHIFLYVIGALMIISMALGIFVSGLAGGTGHGAGF